MLNTYEAFAIFCGLTIGGGIMGLPMAMSNSGYGFSIIVLIAVAYYYFCIYSYLIGLMQKKACPHLHLLLINSYGQYYSLFSSALILVHIYLLLCFVIIRLSKLSRFTCMWTQTNQEFFIDSEWLKPSAAIIVCIMLTFLGNYKGGFKNFRYISWLNLIVWIYFILLAAKDIWYNDKIISRTVKFYNHEESDEIIWNAIEAFNSIHGFALLYYDVGDANIARKAIKYGLWAVLVLYSLVAWLGSSYHLGNLNWMSLAHVGLGKENINLTPFSWPIFIGLIASMITLLISSLLVLNQARISIAHLIDYDQKHFTQSTFNRKSSLWCFNSLLLIGALIFSFDIPFLIIARRIMIFTFCILNPYLIFLKEEGPMFKKHYMEL